MILQMNNCCLSDDHTVQFELYSSMNNIKHFDVLDFKLALFNKNTKYIFKIFL